MANKKNTKKKASKKRVNEKSKNDNETTLNNLIKGANAAVVITATNGAIEIVALKNLNYAYEVKGLLVGALDKYRDRIVSNVSNKNTKTVLAHIMNINNKVDKIMKPGKKEGKE